MSDWATVAVAVLPALITAAALLYQQRRAEAQSAQRLEEERERGWREGRQGAHLAMHRALQEVYDVYWPSMIAASGGSSTDYAALPRGTAAELRYDERRLNDALDALLPVASGPSLAAAQVAMTALMDVAVAVHRADEADPARETHGPVSVIALRRADDRYRQAREEYIRVFRDEIGTH